MQLLFVQLKTLNRKNTLNLLLLKIKILHRIKFIFQLILMQHNQGGFMLEKNIDSSFQHYKIVSLAESFSLYYHLPKHDDAYCWLIEADNHTVRSFFYSEYLCSSEELLQLRVCKVLEIIIIVSEGLEERCLS